MRSAPRVMLGAPHDRLARSRRRGLATGIGLGLGLLSLTVAPPASRATTTSFWISEGPEDLAAGQVDSTAITPEGEIVLAPERAVVARSEEACLWDIAAAGNGTLYLATGNEGRLLEVDGRGQVRILFDAPEEVEAFAVLFDPARGLVAGLSPGANLVAPRAGGAVDTLARLDAKYVWDLVRSPAGDLYIATGQPGRVYRLAAGKTQPELYFDSQDEHVLCLAWHPDGYVLAGTSPKGITFAIAGPGQARALYDAKQRDAKVIAVRADGIIFVAATGDSGEDKSESGNTRMEPAIYRLSPDGTVQRIWRCPEQMLQAMVLAPAGDLLVGTGDKARIYRVATGARDLATVVAMPPESQVVSLLATGEGTYAGTANPGTLYRLGAREAREGFFTASVFDAGQVSRWGALSWEGEAPGGSSVGFECRSGNTAEPGLGWSPWVPVRLAEKTGPILSPPARYLQWRARLARGQAEPRLVRVKAAYLVPNFPPRIARVEVSPSGAPLSTNVPGSPPPTLHQVLPSGVEVQYSVRESAELPPEETAPWARALRTASWEAFDPNEDPLVFHLDLRALGEKEWRPLEKELEGTAYTWNAASLPDGLYQLRVTASDGRGNPPGEELTGEKVSASFVVDNTPPEIARLEVAREAKKGIRVEGLARDRGGTLLRARYSLDGGDWEPAAPADGIYDEAEEAFSFLVADPGPGEHTLALRVVDEAGNVAVRRAVLAP